jgi:hypothetical protein
MKQQMRVTIRSNIGAEDFDVYVDTATVGDASLLALHLAREQRIERIKRSAEALSADELTTAAIHVSGARNNTRSG